MRAHVRSLLALLVMTVPSVKADPSGGVSVEDFQKQMMKERRERRFAAAGQEGSVDRSSKPQIRRTQPAQICQDPGAFLGDGNYDDDDDDGFSYCDDVALDWAHADADKSCAPMTTYSEGKWSAHNCPSECSRGVANVAPTPSDLVYSTGVGYCSSDIDSFPDSLRNENMFSADQCWDACIDEYGADRIHNAEYACDISSGCWCYCQSECSCMYNVGHTSTIFKSVDAGVPPACGDDDDGDDDYYDDDYLEKISTPLYFCTCGSESGGPPFDIRNKAACCSDGMTVCDDEPPLCAQDCMVSGDFCEVSDVSCMSDCETELLMQACTMCEGFPAFDTMCEYAPGGFCFAGSSSVSVLKTAAKSLRAANPPLVGKETTTNKLVSELKVGDKVVSARAPGQASKRPFAFFPNFATVTRISKSKSTESFVEITMEKITNAGAIRATLHHTFTLCNGKYKFAKDIKKGDCLHTVEHMSQGLVHKVKIVAPRPDDMTYTIELEDGTEEVAVGGVFSHVNTLAKSHMKGHGEGNAKLGKMGDDAKARFKKALIEAGAQLQP